jgi:hypothetical protein
MKDMTPIWTIEKDYDDTELTDDEHSIGLGINVNFISIGSAHKEYLVSFDYLKMRMAEIGFRLLNATELKEMNLSASTQTFDESYANMMASKQLGESAKKKYQMIDAVQQFSFLNRWFIFRRGQDVAVSGQDAAVAAPVTEEEMPVIEINEDDMEEKEVDPSMAAVSKDAPFTDANLRGYLNDDTRTFKFTELFRFGPGVSATKDTMGVKTPAGTPDTNMGRWLGFSAPFPIPDPDQQKDGAPVQYPSVEHYLAAMRVRFASNKTGNDAATLAINLFSMTGGIHQQFAAMRSKDKIVNETDADYKYLDAEAVKVRQVVTKKGEILNKSGVVFDEDRWDSLKAQFIAKALQYRMDHDKRFMDIVEAARNSGKYMLYQASATNTTNNAKKASRELGGVYGLSSKRIDGENKVGRILMKLANFNF